MGWLKVCAGFFHKMLHKSRNEFGYQKLPEETEMIEPCWLSVWLFPSQMSPCLPLGEVHPLPVASWHSSSTHRNTLLGKRLCLGPDSPINVNISTFQAQVAL